MRPPALRGTRRARAAPARVAGACSARRTHAHVAARFAAPGAPARSRRRRCCPARRPRRCAAPAANGAARSARPRGPRARISSKASPPSAAVARASSARAAVGVVQREGRQASSDSILGRWPPYRRRRRNLHPSATSLAAQIRALARELGFQRVRHRRRRTRRGRSPPARLAGAGPVRLDGLDGAARRQALAPGRADAGHAAGDLGRAGLRHRTTTTRGDTLARRRARLRRALRAGPRLPQADAQAPADAGRPHRRAKSGRSAIACSSIRRRCSNARWRATPGLGWIGKHTCLIDSDARLVVLPRRDVRRPAAAGRRAGERALRHLHALHRHLPDAGDRRAQPARCAALHFAISPSSTKAASIPELRPLIGNRIFGCDDCQLVCPWNKFAQRTDEPDFRARNDLDTATLPSCSRGRKRNSCKRTEGSAIRRSGYERWLRNIAVALGNAPTTPDGDRLRCESRSGASRIAGRARARRVGAGAACAR